MEHIYLVFKGNPGRGTSQLNSGVLLVRSGYRVTVLCPECTTETRMWLNERGIEVSAIGGLAREKSSGVVRWWFLSTFWLRVWLWWRRTKPVGSRFVIGSLETAAALLPLLKVRPFAIMVHELYDRELRWKVFRKLVIRQARLVVVPNETRAALLRYWCGLKDTPFVIANRPPDDADASPPSPAAQKAIDILHQHGSLERRLILYQGAIDLRERDLLPVAEACHARRSEWTLVLLGDDIGSVEALRRICPSLVYLGHLSAPQHLAVTSVCDVGVVCYRWTSLNTLFCAPNKTWEYGKFGRPMLANDVPALSALMREWRCGVSVNFGHVRDIGAALDEINANYAEYSQNARAYYTSTNEADITRALGERIELAFAEVETRGYNCLASGVGQ